MTLNGAVTQSVGYDALGNITSRSDVGSYTYHPTRKHAVTQAGTRAFTYDANGNMLTRNGQTLAWRGDNLPALIRDQASSGAPVYQSEFAYGPAGERWRQIATYFNGTETIISIAGLLEKYTSSSAAGTTLYRHWIPAPDGTLIQVEVARNAGPGTLTTRYITRDHLGSVDAVLASTAAVLNRESFNAWGARRSATGWTGAPGSTEWAAIADTLRQGYTSDGTNHTHLDNLGLIHMNGRVLDPTLGRFLSADPAIPDPYSSQSWNRYSYVRNNFLSRLDPTGFADEQLLPCDSLQGSDLTECEVFVRDVPLECAMMGIWAAGCTECVMHPFSAGCPDLIHRSPSPQPAEPRDDNPAPAAAPAQAQANSQACYRSGDNGIDLDDVVNFSAGLGDVLLLGFGDEIRAWLDIGSVDMGASAYSAGELTGSVALSATGLAGGVRAAGARGAGMEFSHAVPARMGGPRSIWNGNYVTTRTHALSDPYRFRFMPQAWKRANPMPSRASQLWTRTPNTIKGTSAGAGAAGLGLAGAWC